MLRSLQQSRPHCFARAQAQAHGHTHTYSQMHTRDLVLRYFTRQRLRGNLTLQFILVGEQNFEAPLCFHVNLKRQAVNSPPHAEIRWLLQKV